MPFNPTTFHIPIASETFPISSHTPHPLLQRSLSIYVDYIPQPHCDRILDMTFPSKNDYVVFAFANTCS